MLFMLSRLQEMNLLCEEVSFIQFYIISIQKQRNMNKCFIIFIIRIKIN